MQGNETQKDEAQRGSTASGEWTDGWPADRDLSEQNFGTLELLKFTEELKLQSFGHLVRRTDSLEKTLMLVEIEGRRRRG